MIDSVDKIGLKTASVVADETRHLVAGTRFLRAVVIKHRGDQMLVWWITATAKIDPRSRPPATSIDDTHQVAD
jgi:hypothetical protein